MNFIETLNMIILVINDSEILLKENKIIMYNTPRHFLVPNDFILLASMLEEK